MTDRYRIVIIGGGFTGTALAIYLGRQAQQPLEVTVIEPRAALGGGVAYSTTDPAHRINVPAAKMQLSDAEQGDFDRWFRSGDELARDPQALWRDGAVYPQRGAFGRFIAARFAETASRSRATLRHMQDRAVDWLPTAVGATIVTAGGERIDANITILAVSHPPPSLPARLALALGQHPALIADPWRENALATVSPTDNVAIIGTGLTMADIVASLQLRGHRGHITAFSRRGLLPRPNVTGSDVLWSIEPPLDSSCATTRNWLRRVRQAVAQAAAEGVPWQAVLDDVRTRGQALWQQLSTLEQRRFLRHVRPYWDVHRYRIAPQVSALLQEKQRAGVFCVLAARLGDIAVDGVNIELHLRRRDGGDEHFTAQKFIVSTGPAHGSLVDDNLLLRGLAALGQIQPDELGLGLLVDAQSQAIGFTGEANRRLLVAGPAARGRFGELMGLPQVAEHAQSIANALLSKLPSLSSSGRCPASTL